MSNSKTLFEDTEIEILEENYYRLIGFVVDLIMTIFRKIIVHKMGHENFHQFLTSHKHKIYHLWINDISCCQCFGSNKYLNEKELSQEQITYLFTIDGHTKRGHHKIRNDKTIQHCLCKFDAKAGASLDDLDIALACTILLKVIGKWNPIERKSIQTIKKLRNKISHVTCTRSLTTEEFQKIWDKLEYSILYLADGVSKDLHQEAKKLIMHFKSKTLESKYCVQVYILLKTWENRDALLTEMTKMLCTQQHHTNILEDQTSMLKGLLRSILLDEDITRRNDEILLEEIKSEVKKILDQKMTPMKKRFARLEREKRKYEHTAGITESRKKHPEKDLTNNEDENYIKLSLIFTKIFTLVLRMVFKAEWDRQNPTFPWKDNLKSRNRFIEMEKRPTKRGKSCKEQIRNTDGDTNHWDFNLLANVLCHCRVLDLIRKNCPLYQGVQKMLELQKDFARRKCFIVKNDELEALFRKIEYLFETVPELRFGLEILKELRNSHFIIPAQSTSNHKPSVVKQILPQYWTVLFFIFLFCLMTFIFVLLQWQIDELQLMLLNQSGKIENKPTAKIYMLDSYLITVAIAIILALSFLFRLFKTFVFKT